MEEISTWWVVANIAGWLTITAILNYFGLQAETIIILSVMLLLDRIFGIVQAYMEWNLESQKMVAWLVKKLTRWCIPFIVIWVLRWAWFGNMEIIATSILSILIVAEWYSIIWHIYSINYKKTLPEIDALKLLVERIAKIFRWKIDDVLKEEKKD